MYRSELSQHNKKLLFRKRLTANMRANGERLKTFPLFRNKAKECTLTPLFNIRKAQSYYIRKEVKYYPEIEKK